MKQTPTTIALGGGGVLILLGGFASGFYLGHSQAKGHPVDSNVYSLLKYGPAMIGGLYGAMVASAESTIPKGLEGMSRGLYPDMNPNPAKAKGCTRGCGPTFCGVAGAVLTGAATYLGYVVGHSMS
jgi:hypothetical protein